MIKPNIKFNSDGTIHEDGKNSIAYCEIFGSLPLNEKQSKQLMRDFLKVFEDKKPR